MSRDAIDWMRLGTVGNYESCGLRAWGSQFSL